MSKLIIEIHKGFATPRTVISGKTGKPVTFNEQDAYVRYPDAPYPEAFIINVDPDESGKVVPIEPGIYTVDLNSIVEVGRFKTLELDARKLVSSMEKACEVSQLQAYLDALAKKSAAKAAA